MIRLDLSNGQGITSAYKDYYIAMLIGSRKWRSDLITHWTTSGRGSNLITINGKVYWGGIYDLNHLNEDPEKIKMADLLGIDDAAKDEIHAAGVSGDTDWVYAQFRVIPKTDNPFDAENFAYMYHNAFAPTAVQKGLSTVTLKSIDVVVPCVWFTRTIIDVNGTITSNTITYSSSYLPENTTSTSESVTTGTPPDEVTTVTTTTIITGLDDPALHAPAPLPMKTFAKTANAYHPNFSEQNTFYYPLVEGEWIASKTPLKLSGLGEAIASIYAIGNFFENHVSHSVRVPLVKTNYNFLIPTLPVSWVFQTHDVFNTGDWSWLSYNAALDELFPMVSIGQSKEADYFSFIDWNGVGSFGIRPSSDASSISKNLSGRIMDVVDGTITGNNALANIIAQYRSPYAWALAIDGRLWFEHEYVMNMDIKEFTHLLASHLDIQVGADSGFFGTFIGGFIGAVIGLVSAVLDVFFKIVELLDFVMKPIINAILKYVFKMSDAKRERWMSAYTQIRNAAALIVAAIVTGGFISAASASSSATAAGATAAEVATISAYDVMAFEVMNMGAMDLAMYGIQIASAAYTGYNAPLSEGTGAVASVAEETATNQMGIVYESNSVDYIDAIYMSMDDPMMMLEMANDPFAIVYS